MRAASQPKTSTSQQSNLEPVKIANFRQSAVKIPANSEFADCTFAPQAAPLLRGLTLCERAKTAFYDALINPALRPDLFTGNRRPPRAILLFGPAGTGKTFVARAAANEAGLPLVTASAATLMDKFVGESEKRLRALFKYCA